MIRPSAAGVALSAVGATALGPGRVAGVQLGAAGRTRGWDPGDMSSIDTAAAADVSCGCCAPRICCSVSFSLRSAARSVSACSNGLASASLARAASWGCLLLAGEQASAEPVELLSAVLELAHQPERDVAEAMTAANYGLR